MGIYISDLEIPKDKAVQIVIIRDDGVCVDEWGNTYGVVSLPSHGRLNVIGPYMQHDEDDGFDELIKPSDIDYMHTPSVEEIIKGDGLDSFIKHFED